MYVDVPVDPEAARPHTLSTLHLQSGKIFQNIFSPFHLLFYFNPASRRREPRTSVLVKLFLNKMSNISSSPHVIWDVVKNSSNAFVVRRGTCWRF